MVKIYVTGEGGLFRKSVEKLSHISSYSQKTDAKLVGIRSDDVQTIDAELISFDSNSSLYRHAAQQDGKILICDFGSPSNRSANIAKSLKNGFNHLAERPSALRREDYLRQKSLADSSKVRWMVDHHERENPVIKGALSICSGGEVERLHAVCQNSKGSLAALKKYGKHNIQGGDTLTAMNHLIYGLDFMNADSLVDSQAKYFLPAGHDSLMSLSGGRKFTVDSETASAQSKAVLQGSGRLVLHSSLLGISDEARDIANEIESQYGHNPINTEVVDVDGSVVKLEDARFFKLQGKRELFGDLANKKLIDLETGEDIKLHQTCHSPLYRLLEKSCLESEGYEVFPVTEEENEKFSKMLFDIKDRFEGKFQDEIRKSADRLETVKVG